MKLEGGGVKALMARPLSKNFFAVSQISVLGIYYGIFSGRCVLKTPTNYVLQCDAIRWERFMWRCRLGQL